MEIDKPRPRFAHYSSKTYLYMNPSTKIVRLFITEITGFRKFERLSFLYDIFYEVGLNYGFVPVSWICLYVHEENGLEAKIMNKNAKIHGGKLE